MGKRIITQRRGRGTHTYKSPSHRFKGKIRLRPYDDIEKNKCIIGQVKDFVHCPGHTAPLAKIKFENGEHLLIFAVEGLNTKQKINSGSKSEIQIGNILPLKNIPIGTTICNIESHPGDGGKFMRAAGASARITAKDDKKVTIVFPSKKIKKITAECRAIIGKVAGAGKKDKPILKAGKKYHMMKAKNKLYPITSGVAMNAVDHPFGSGRGRHAGKPKTPPRNAPPGRNVGAIRAKKTGKRK